MSARMKRLALSRAGRLRIMFELSGHSPGMSGLFVLALRDSLDAEGGLCQALSGENAAARFYAFAAEQVGSRGVYRTEIDLSRLDWRESYWDAFICESADEGAHQLQNGADLVEDADKRAHIAPLKTPRHYGASLKVRCVQAYTPDGGIVFPYTRADGELAFTYRLRKRQDSPTYRLREIVADAALVAMGSRIRKRNIWLVYEKFCERAQDNGFYFFKYCMETLPPEERARIFYVIDKQSPDYERVKPWRSNVCDFMGVRHLLYASCAQMIVASESLMHAYLWRAKPSYVRRRIYARPIFFLQHGVTALKHTHGVFGRMGDYPVDYYVTTSEHEKDIIVDNYGYDRDHAPVLGFTRWDALEDHSSVDAPLVLVMPTWREWMSCENERDFVDSEFFRQYSRFLGSESLSQALRRVGATVVFYVHPRFSRFSHLFNVDSDVIRIVHADEAPLNELIMQCSALVTDYSSVTWDVAYQGKPVFFLQFDQDEYLERTGSYIDLHGEMPGPSFEDAERLVDELSARFVSGLSRTEREAAIADEWFAYRDRANCERTYRYVRDLNRGANGKAGAS